MENLDSNRDSEQAAWVSFYGAADPKLHPTRDHTHHRQHSQGFSSQSRSFQLPQLNFLTPTDEHPPSTPQLLSNAAEKEAAVAAAPGQQCTASPPPLRRQQQQQTLTQTHHHTVTSIPTSAHTADFHAAQPPLAPRRNAEDTNGMTTESTRSLTHSHVHTGESQGLHYSSSSSSTVPHPSRIPPAAVAAAAAVMHPSFTSHLSATDGADMGGDMEVKRESLEDYLDLQDDDDDTDSDDDGSCTEGGATYPGRQASDLAHPTSQHSQPARGNGRVSLWMADLCEMASDGPHPPSSTAASKEATDTPLAHSPRASSAELRSDGNAQRIIHTSGGNAVTSPGPVGAATAVAPVPMPRTSALKKVQPPPLSGFTPVVTVIADSTPPDNKTSGVNPNNTNTNTNTTAAAGHARNTSTTPQPPSLGFSSKVSPPSHRGSADLVEEERRLREELQALRQRVWETEQKLAKVQRCMAEPSSIMNSSSTAAPAAEGVETQRFIQQQQQQQQLTAVMAQVDSRTLDPAAVALPPQGVFMVPSPTAPRYTVGVPSLERNPTPSQQHHQQQYSVAPTSMGSTLYAASTPPSASVTMSTRPTSAEPSGPSGGRVAYLVQSSNAPFGVYAVPPAGNPIQAGTPGPAAAAANTSNAAAVASTTVAATTAAAMLSSGAPSAGSTVQVLNAQPYMMNNQPTICYMVLTPSQQQQQQQQSQQLASSGMFATSMPPPEFGSANKTTGCSGTHMNSTVLTHMPVLTTAQQVPLPPPPPPPPPPPATIASSAGANRPPEVSVPYPHVAMVGPASNGELTRKCFNVHGSMMGVVPYFPYDETAPPAPTATILTAPAASPSASVLGQSMSGAGWSTRSMNGGAATEMAGGLGSSWRSHDGVVANDSGAFQARSCGSNTPSNNTRSSPPAPGDIATAPVLPIFIQMFPCELHDRAAVLNRVIEATCGRDCGVVQRIEPRSETSFIAHVRTHQVWQLIYKLRCRVLMDRFGFWYAADLDQYVRMKEYCEGVRRLPQQTRHFQTDGLPCMPLVVELSRAVDKMVVTENNAPRTFDEIVPMAAVDRHRTRLQQQQQQQQDPSTVKSSGGGFPPALSASGAFTETNTMSTAGNIGSGSNCGPMLSSAPPQRGGTMTGTTAEMRCIAVDNTLGGSTRAAQAMHADGRPPPPPPFT
jgi:hypothetical protein